MPEQYPGPGKMSPEQWLSEQKDVCNKGGEFYWLF